VGFVKNYRGASMSNINSADVGFEKQLWGAADLLRV